jgi:hypothetical protein
VSIIPTPPAAACTSAVSPGRTVWDTAAQWCAVRPCKSKAAAVSSSTASGTGTTPLAGSTICPPGAFRTSLFGKGAACFSEEHPAYAEKAGVTRKLVHDGDGTRSGDPAEAVAAIRLALNAENILLRLALGGAAGFLVGHLDSVRAERATWEQVSRGTDFDTHRQSRAARIRQSGRTRTSVPA